MPIGARQPVDAVRINAIRCCRSPASTSDTAQKFIPPSLQRATLYPRLVRVEPDTPEVPVSTGQTNTSISCWRRR